MARFRRGMEASIRVMRILALLPLFVNISNDLGIQIFFPFKRDRIILISVIVGGIVNLVIA